MADEPVSLGQLPPSDDQELIAAIARNAFRRSEKDGGLYIGLTCQRFGSELMKRGWDHKGAEQERIALLERVWNEWYRLLGLKPLPPIERWASWPDEGREHLRGRRHSVWS